MASVLLYAAGRWELAALAALVSLGAALSRGPLEGTASWFLAVGSGIVVLAVIYGRDRPCTSDSFNGLTCTTSATPNAWHAVLVGAVTVALGLAGLARARHRRTPRHEPCSTS
jgi:hypothetical protein